MMLSHPGDPTYDAEVRELRHQGKQQKLAMSRRSARNSPLTHPDAREPDDDEPTQEGDT